MESKHHLAKLLVSTILSVAFASSFIAFFFFTYAKNVERLIVVNNVKYIITDLFRDVISKLPKEFNQLLVSQINNVQLPNMDEEDEKVKKGNEKLLDQSWSLYSKVLIGAAVIALIISVLFRLNILEIAVTNFVLLGAVALTEYLFLNNVIAKFISADPNVLKLTILEKLFE
jgi:hypothetical protein